jgi:hypothetical protein
MFIKINIHCQYNNEIVTIVASSPSDSLQIISIIDNSNIVIAWNMEEYKPEDFGFLKSINWNKWKENFYT